MQFGVGVFLTALLVFVSLASGLEFPTEYQVLAQNSMRFYSTIGNNANDIQGYYVDVTDYIRNASGLTTPHKIVAELDSSSLLFANGSVAVTGLATWDHPTQSDWVETERWVPLVQSAHWNYSIPFSNIWTINAATFAYSNATRSLYAWGTNSNTDGFIDITLSSFVFAPIKIGSSGGTLPVDIEVVRVTAASVGGTFALVHPGRVYYWGYADPSYLSPAYNINHGPIAPSPLPGAVSANTTFSHICGLGQHVVLFSQQTGKFYWFGRDRTSLATSWADVTEYPARVGEFASAEIVEMSCSGDAVLVRTLTGEVWAFGVNFAGEFGNGEWNVAQYTPPSEAVKIPFPVPIKRIVDNREYTLIALSDTYAYAWGQAVYDSTGITGFGDTLGTPQIISYNGVPVQNATDAALQVSSFLVLHKPGAEATPPPPTPVISDTLPVWTLSICLGLVCAGILSVLLL